MNDQPALLTVDVGSSSVRCRLYGRSLRGIACDGGVRRYRWRTAGGSMEVDAPMLLGSVADVLDAGVAAARAYGMRIEGVAIATFWHGLVAFDPSGEPVTPLYGWGDARAVDAAGTLERRLGAGAYHRRTGCILDASYPAARLLWLRETAPDTFDGAAVWGSIGEHLEWRFFGSPRTSISIASGTGLLNAATLEWDAETLDAVGLDAGHLPPLTDVEPRRGLAGEWAARWPSLAHVPWYPALGDGACANVGSGAVGADRQGVTVGTSAAARVVVSGTPLGDLPTDLWLYRLDAGHPVVGTALSNGGSGIAFLLERFPQVTAADVDGALRDGRPDAHGLTVVPSLIRERGGGWPDAGGATIVGLRPTTRPVEVVVAWIEAMTQRVAERSERLAEYAGSPAELLASGGVPHALPGWLQTLADAAGLPVRMPDDPEATSRGAAIMAARALGWIGSLAAPDDTDGARVAHPRPGYHEIHRAALRRQRELAGATAGAVGDADPRDSRT